ncbi:pyridoxamine 5'-phosphate oxidase family protein [Nocardiopsis ansamitocini]|uniref:Flavin-nucleotide-binding protein n=1 Tax=Nocardiopsis ansamitocini TaxID=1670832 RepID=A0A9W6UGN4_9ACTN|nr:pyridoxamine 5'-phosphate oxidase family protein [Nocardiopsis ansamitocini]GLU45767.1 hypothetical protein Nans01_01180 [Nocardiopsis ansamitocini]
MSHPPAPTDYTPTPRSTPTRNRDRAHYDTATVHAILDADFICHMGFIADDAPVVLPTLYARVDDRLYLHGSSGSRPLRNATGAGLAVCVTVTLTDGLVLARSAMHHSLNYRSVVVHGTAERVTEQAELDLAFTSLVNQVVPGRAGDCRAPSPKEQAQTAVLRLDLEEVSAKVRTGGVGDAPEDLGLAHWAGVVPVRRVLGEPVPDPALPAGTRQPGYLRAAVESARQAI